MVDKLQSAEICKGEVTEMLPTIRAADAAIATVVAIVGLVDDGTLLTRRREAECRGTILIVDVLREGERVEERALEEGEHLVIVESDVVINRDTFVKLNKTVKEGVGLVASVTVDEKGEVNFPYLFAKKWKEEDKSTKKRISFCCTLLTNEFLKLYDFSCLDSTKDWYDVFISHKSVELGLRNILMMSDKVLHRPHSSRPWKLLKYTNPVKYYWIKYTKGFDKI